MQKKTCLAICVGFRFNDEFPDFMLLLIALQHLQSIVCLWQTHLKLIV